MNATNGTYDVSTRDGLIAFYDETFDAVYRCAVRLTRGNQAAAEDLTQDAFVRLTRSARSGSVQAIGVGWMITTVRRLFIDRLRSNESEDRRVQLAANTLRQTSEWAPPPMSESSDLLEGLSDREQAVLLLRYVEDLPVADVAVLMGTSVRATESILQRAKSKARSRRSPQ